MRLAQTLGDTEERPIHTFLQVMDTTSLPDRHVHEALKRVVENRSKVEASDAGVSELVSSLLTQAPQSASKAKSSAGPK